VSPIKAKGCSLVGRSQTRRLLKVLSPNMQAHASEVALSELRISPKDLHVLSHELYAIMSEHFATPSGRDIP